MPPLSAIATLVPGSNAGKRWALWERLDHQGIADTMQWLPYNTNLRFDSWDGLPIIHVGHLNHRSVYVDHEGNLVRFADHGIEVIQRDVFNPVIQPRSPLLVTCPLALDPQWHKNWVALCQLYLQFEAQRTRYEDVSMNCPTAEDVMEIILRVVNLDRSALIAHFSTVTDITDAVMDGPSFLHLDRPAIVPAIPRVEMSNPPNIQSSVVRPPPSNTAATAQPTRPPTPVLGRDLAALARLVGAEEMRLLPRPRASMYERAPIGTGTSFQKIAVHVGTFNNNFDMYPRGTHDTFTLTGSKVYAALRRERNIEKSPATKLYARVGPHRLVSKLVGWEDFARNIDLRPEFRPAESKREVKDVKREMKENKPMIKALVKYYILLAAKNKVFGFTDHRVVIKQTFVDYMRTICSRLADESGNTLRRSSRNAASSSRAAAVSANTSHPQDYGDTSSGSDSGSDDDQSDHPRYAAVDSPGFFSLPIRHETRQVVRLELSNQRRLRTLTDISDAAKFRRVCPIVSMPGPVTRDPLKEGASCMKRK